MLATSGFLRAAALAAPRFAAVHPARVSIRQATILSQRRLATYQAVLASPTAAWTQRRFCAAAVPPTSKSSPSEGKDTGAASDSTLKAAPSAGSKADTSEPKPESGSTTDAKPEAATEDAQKKAETGSDGAKTEKPEPRGPFKKYIKLARQYGLALLVYYLIADEVGVIILTALLQYDVLGGGDLLELVKQFGIGKDLDVKSLMDKSFSIGPISVSARLATNYTIASCVFGAMAPGVLPFCIATLPAVMRFFGRDPSKAVAAASAAAAAAPAASTAAAATTSATAASAASSATSSAAEVSATVDSSAKPMGEQK